ncbi:hypothetical protein HY968_01600 [Candidatus Kaiserbacteria bacterium]|nr:hypothetical protein [Candidatus Kaiserbacteria bacterium]
MTVSNILTNFDLFALGVATSALVLMGTIAYLENRASATARAFCIFAFATVIWNLTNYFQYQFRDPAIIIMALRFNLFAAIIHAYAFFRFAYVFPKDEIRMPKWERWLVAPVAFIVALMTQTPLIFSGIELLAPQGQVTRAAQGPAIPAFGVVAFGLLLLGLFFMSVHRRRSSYPTEREQLLLGFAGMSATALLILLFNLVLPLSFNTLSFLPYAGIFMFPLIGFLAYTIYKHHLFNLKALAVQALTFILGAITFVEVVLTRDPVELLFRSSLLVAIIGAGIMLTRSVTRDIEQRETIQTQEKELEVVNAQQENLLHFISHEIKGYLTEGQNAFASIVEGDFGVAPPPMKEIASTALSKMRKGVATIMDILDAANLKKGTVAFKKEPFDFKSAVETSIQELSGAAKGKNLTIEFVPTANDFDFTGDKEKMTQHVVRNLIDNAIRYTPSGSIRVSLERQGNKIVFAVKDSGVGITPEDMTHLFTEGGHGKDSIKINVHSTGYGLFIAKQVTEAHGGKISAQSDGQGKGSTFMVELPVQI